MSSLKSVVSQVCNLKHLRQHHILLNQNFSPFGIRLGNSEWITGFLCCLKRPFTNLLLPESDVTGVIGYFAAIIWGKMVLLLVRVFIESYEPVLNL